MTLRITYKAMASRMTYKAMRLCIMYERGLKKMGAEKGECLLRNDHALKIESVMHDIQGYEVMHYIREGPEKRL